MAKKPERPDEEYAERLKTADKLLTEAFPDMPRFSECWGLAYSKLFDKITVNKRFKLEQLPETAEGIPKKKVDWSKIEK